LLHQTCFFTAIHPKMPNSKRMLPTPTLVVILILVPLFAIVALKLKQVENPPSDFGGGSMFDQIATRYDTINKVLALRMDVGWRRQMAQQVKQRLPETNPRLLDVATGTADVALQLAKDIPTSTILGIDPSNNMLEVGRVKIQQQGLQERIELLWGDARDFSKYSANTFDGATMAFGIRNVPERDVALCEIHRLLKPSGVLAILEFSEPDDSFGVLGILARMFIRYVVPLVGGVLSGAPREYLHLQNSIKDFPTPPRFKKLMENLSCGEDAKGHYEMEDVMHMNFGSVQLYVGTAVKSSVESATIEPVE
jgi:demethylmenaquinone methyltransferase/2-methoxy-6-polyprenyl-1,4-benzoquinol methylase